MTPWTVAMDIYKCTLPFWGDMVSGCVTVLADQPKPSYIQLLTLLSETHWAALATSSPLVAAIPSPRPALPLCHQGLATAVHTKPDLLIISAHSTLALGGCHGIDLLCVT